MRGPSAEFNKRAALMPLVFGVLSGLIYLSYVVSILFLVPIQFAFSKHGKRTGLVSAACAAATILAGYVGRIAAVGQLDLTLVLMGAVPALVLLGAIVFVDAAWAKAKIGLKLAVASAAISIAAIPLVSMATTDSAFMSWLQQVVQRAFSGTGLDASNAVELAKQSIESAKAILQNACGAMILWFIAGSWWLGSSIARRSKAREEAMAAALGAEPVTRGEPLAPGTGSGDLDLASVKVPPFLLWPTLILWSILFALLVSHTSGIALAVAWNLALGIASWYGVQGLGIIKYLIGRTRNPTLFKLIVPTIALLAIVSTVAGTIILIALPVLGISEVWLPYRNFKGASV